MTCIIAHRDGWMVADRRQTFQESLIGPYRTAKIKRCGGLLVASSGNGVFQDLIAEALAGASNSGTDTALHAVAQVFREKGDIGGHALALSALGICEITSNGAVCWVDADHWAIGSGYPFALGWLAAKASLGPLGVDDALHAINFASTRTNDVGDGYQVEKL